METVTVATRGHDRWVAVLLTGAVAVAVAAVIWSSVSGSRPLADDERVVVIAAIPPPLLAAELFAASPDAATLHDLYSTLGGTHGLEVATATGAFDLVRFDPTDRSRLLAARRRSYGTAENQRVNELWMITDGPQVDQRIWNPDVSHDFVHFNVDGTATMWVHGGGGGFAPRVAVMLDGDLAPTASTAPLYASRFSAAQGTVFALTGDGDYYSNEPGYLDLVADDGSGAGPLVLGDGSPFAWIDNPTPDILVAYPRLGHGLTSVWDVATLTPRPDHPLAGRTLRRAAVSGNGRVALGATLDGRLEVVDLETGIGSNPFGRVDVAGVDQPLALDHDGAMAVIVERTGRVSLWWVESGERVISIGANAGQPRWVSEAYAPTSASVIAPDASRIALRLGATAQVPLRWQIIDTSVASWIERACDEAGRALDEAERLALGLPAGQRACAS